MDLHGCINYLLTTAQHAVSAEFAARMAEHGVTPTQCAVLNCLWDSEAPVNPKDIAQQLCLETSTVSGVLDRMQKKDLIDRLIDPNDRRCVLVTISDAGRALEPDILRVIDEANAAVLADFAPEEREMIKCCLRRLGGHVTA